MIIDTARPSDYAALGELVAGAYARLPGMATPDEQPGYYAMLRDVAARARNPAVTVFAARDDAGDGALAGCVDFIADVRAYGAGDVAARAADAAGIRLLAVADAHRGRGVGKALTRFCLERARDLGRARVILHTTRAMQTAWAMYEKLGFARFAEIDFKQGELDVFGFVLPLTASCAASP
jgi:GNAT superfamily N-acetyltransferase